MTEEATAWDWFNLNPTFTRTLGISWKPFNAFHRHLEQPDGRVFGFGLLQFGQRHLIYIGYSESFRWSFLFMNKHTN